MLRRGKDNLGRDGAEVRHDAPPKQPAYASSMLRRGKSAYAKASTFAKATVDKSAR
jgi:hypothetical protein